MTDPRLLDPLAASKRISESYQRYLKSRHAPQDPRLRRDFFRALETDFPLVSGPLLQASAPYETASTLRQLINEGMLNGRFGEMPTSAFPLERPLYKHQEQAIRKLVGGRNLIIATGTGSGKTECFLFPILNHLLNERDAGTLDAAGVRSMLLYPMNALANDQMKRLKRVLAVFPEITFGRFIGDTRDPHREALEVYEHRFGTHPLPNELISREQMRENPPHILLTNYAMLEYLLLRPAETKLFDGPTGRHWRFIVLDEVHVYNGAQGAEIAMLLRRVRDRVNRSTRGSIQYIGTSATLGTEGEYPALAQYGRDLFDECLEYLPGDSERQDLVLPVKSPLVQKAATWHATRETFTKISGMFSSGTTAPTSLVSELAAMGAPQPEPDQDPVDYVAESLVRERHVVQLQGLLENESIDITAAAKSVFGDNSEVTLMHLLNACSRAEFATTGISVIPSRYHFLLRALEGAFLCQSPFHPTGRPRLRLNRHKYCPECIEEEVQSKMFESGVCSKCGVLYLLGMREDQGAGVYLRSARAYNANLTYLLLQEQIASDDEDEEAAVNNDLVAAAVDQRMLCTECGLLSENSQSFCDCGAGQQVRVTVAHPSKPGEPLRRCLACSGRSTAPIVLRFLTGQDAPVSVIATALYQSIPPDSKSNGLIKVGEGRKLLSFSDSRQAAAFFAPYLDRTYSRAIERRLIWEVLERLHESAPRFEDLVTPIRRVAEEALVLDEDHGTMWNNNQVRRWLMREILAVDRRQSLDGVGLAEITFALPRRLTEVPALNALGFTREEAFDLARVMLDTLRIQAAVHLPDGVDISHPTFAPRNVVTRVRLEQRASKILSWLPGAGLNRRLDYLKKVLSRRGINQDARELLGLIWQNWIAKPRSPWNKVLTQVNSKRHGVLFALDPEWVTMRLATPEQPAFRCNVCRQIWWRSVSSVCPTYTCEGTLQPLATATAQRDEHYRHLYTTLDPIGLRVEEHTGQLGAEYAGRIQQEFLEGEINALSCSTTFELGVDVGEVQAVLMRNVPPSPANYVQRSGRAGRRIGSSALAVTFAQRRSHDLHYFDNPRALVDGHVPTPIVSLRNAQIVRRHLHAVAFAAFERAHVASGGEWHRTVSSFFVGDSIDTPPPVDRFVNWLQSHPKELGEAVTRITPLELATELGTQNWSWVEALIQEDEGENFGWLGRAKKEVQSDLEEVNAQLDKVSEKITRHRQDGRNRAAEAQAGFQRGLLRLKTTLEERQLIQYLAQRVVLPKYGFPVDVVSLDIRRPGDVKAGRLDLSRDLRVGITDYAPGSLIVADKKLWEPIGLRVPPGKTLIDYVWATCKDCGAFRSRLGTEHDACQICGSHAVSSSRIFVMPVFGFIGRPSDQRPGESRPPKAGYSVFHFNDYASTPPEFEYHSVANLMVAVRTSRQGQITVINQGPANRGFQICTECGYAGPAPTNRIKKGIRRGKHTRPGRDSKCGAILKNRQLGHQYLTDVVEVRLPVPMSHNQHLSTLHALLSATHSVGIVRGDVNGTLRAAGTGNSSMVLFDAVPGGAGHTKRIAERLTDLLQASYDVVANCECGEDSSCYGCLRSYPNAAYHDELVRGEAMAIIGQVLDFRR